MVDVGICQKNARNRSVARWISVRLQVRGAFDLPRQIRRCIDQEPALNVFGVAADGDAGLRLRSDFPSARGDTVRAGAIPLRQAAASCAAENVDANQPKFFAVVSPV